MEKKGKIITYVVLMLLVASSLGAINLTKVRDMISMDIEKEDNFDFLVQSEWVGKLGVDIDMEAYMDECRENNNCPDDFVDIGNLIIDHAYGLVIFEVPVIVNQETLDEIVAEMIDMNAEILRSPEGKYFVYPLFSEKLISKLLANNFDLLDIMAVIREGEDSAEKYCDAYRSYLDDDDRLQSARVVPLTQDEDELLSLCSAKPDEVFKRVGMKYILMLDDLSLPSYQRISDCRLKTQCPQKQGVCDTSTCGVNFVTTPDQSACEVAGCTWTLVDSICTAQYLPVCGFSENGYNRFETKSNSCMACQNGGFYVQGECPDHEWASVKTDEVCFMKDIRMTKDLRLSDIKVEITEKAGDIFIGLGDKGINEIAGISGKYQFAQYAYEVNHDNAYDYQTWNGEKGFTVLSNSDDIIDASNGEIGQSGAIDDLWYGLKTGKVATAPLFWVNAVHMVSLFGLMIGLIITGVA